MGSPMTRASTGWHVLITALLALVSVAAAPAPVQTVDPAEPTFVRDVNVTGQVLYGSAAGAQNAAEVDIVDIYNNNPAYMRLKAFGLQETEGRGKKLFDEARATTNKALASVARRHGVDVITVKGGVEGGEAPDLTREVIEDLPVFAVEGPLLHGSSPRGLTSVGEVDSDQVLQNIAAYVEWKALRPDDARYHLLQQTWKDLYAKAIKKVARDQGLDGIVEKGDVTSRLGAVPDVTRAVVQALPS